MSGHRSSVAQERLRNDGDSDSTASNLSFKRWHRKMQTEHETRVKSGEPYFGLWKWCHYLCCPCRWFDSIQYQENICKCCFKFKTFKTMGTILLVGIFCYMFLYSMIGQEVLPGGSIFFLFVMFLAAYVLGYSLMYAGLPAMFGHLIVGICFRNVPSQYFLPYEIKYLQKVTSLFEKLFLIIALIRAGLLLDLSRIKHRFQIILRISFFPLLCECCLVWLFSHFLLHLPWEWGALQGSMLCIVSLASITSIMEMNRALGYGEDKHLSTVLIAAGACDVIFGVFLVAINLSYIYRSEHASEKKVWYVVGRAVQQIAMGLSVGLVSGFLAAFFPDKRNHEAAALRIIVIGTGGFGIANLFYVFKMEGAGVLAVVVMCVIAGNMWEEIGWHQFSNPVQYFYSCAYYFSQPVALSLVGFSMKFTEMNGQEVALSFAVIFIGLIGKEVVCYLSTLGNAYPTTCKEKIFICIAWFSKGTFQVILSYSTESAAEENYEHYSAAKIEAMVAYAKIIKLTTVLAVLITTPLAYFSLAKLTPYLLKKKEMSLEDAASTEEGNEAMESQKHLQKMFFHRNSFKKTNESRDTTSIDQ